MAALHRCHPDYTKETATARTHVILTHRLLQSKSHDEKKLDRLRDALAKLKRRQPEKTTGRHLYLSDLHAVARGKIWTEQKQKPNDFQIRIMRKHAQFWAEKTETCRRIYETQARMRTAAKRGEISEELEAVRSQIALLEGNVGEALGQLAHQFCVSFKEHSSATYTISIYGDHAAALLARSWCRVMQHFF